MKAALRLFVMFGVAVFASQASAGDKVWSVPGVINNGLATAISCTNGTTAAATVNVDVFDQGGSLSGTGNASIPAGQSNTFVTKAVAMLPSATLLGAGDVRGGAATISAPSGVYCTA